MPAQMAKGKFQGLMIAATPRGSCHWWFSLAHESAQALRLEEADGHAGVELAEVDGLADVGVGLAPGFARLADHDPGQLVAPAAQDRRGPHQDRRAVRRLAIAPGGKGGPRPRHRSPRVVGRGPSGDFRHPGGAHRLAKGLALAAVGKVPRRLIEKRPAIAQAGDRRAELMPLGRGQRVGVVSPGAS